MLVLSQRVHQGHPQARGPVHACHAPLRPAGDRGQRESEIARGRARHAGLPLRAERRRPQRSHGLSAREMLLEFGRAPAEPALHRALKENAMTRRAAWMLAFALALLTAPIAQAQSGHKLLGGPRGIVKSSKGDLLEGMMVQLIAQKS